MADITKARELLGWQPRTPLHDGIPKAVEWFRERRAAHPEEDLPLVVEGTELEPQQDGLGFKAAAPARA